MLVVPYGWDQPDNGARVERLSAGLGLARTSYSAEAADALGRLLGEPGYAERAGAIGAALSQEEGLSDACHAIEAVVT
jgi:UDP:flavonoid glycosyltransferase YjiC (YdhE family)